jgi:hypothetical protein
MKNGHRMDALSRFAFGGQNLALRVAAEMKQALLIDGICLLLLLLGWAGAALGQTQDQQKDQKQTQQQPSSQSAPQAAPAATPQEDSVAEAARKAKAKKAKTEKKVYSEEDLARMKGGVSVVGDGHAAANSSADSDPEGAAIAEDNERQWRERAQQIHSQLDETDEQIKSLKEDIKKNGASGFNLQRGLKGDVAYVNDKNARLQKLQNQKKALEQELDQLQEEARKAGVPPEWVR